MKKKKTSYKNKMIFCVHDRSRASWYSCRTSVATATTTLTKNKQTNKQANEQQQQQQASK